LAENNSQQGYSQVAGGKGKQKAGPQTVEKNYLVDLAENYSKSRTEIFRQWAVETL
jgi:hypothetical protein